MSTLSVRQAERFFDPYRPEHYEDEGIKNTYSSAFLKVHQKSLESSIPDLYLAEQSQYFRTLSEGLQQAMSKKIQPEVAPKRVANKWGLISERSGKELQTRRWNSLREKYPEAIRNRLKDYV
jgi:multiple sugar transport system substrate-binding protein